MYLSVAQSIRTGQGSTEFLHWSPFTFVEFTVDVNAPDVDSITATPQNELGKIALTVNRDTTGGNPAWQRIEIESSLDGSTDWQPVWGATGVEPSDPDTFTIDDHALGNSTNGWYRARATRYVGDFVYTSDWVTTGPVAWTSDDVWLKNIEDPTLNRTVELRDPIDGDAAVNRGLHPVAGSERFVAVWDGLKSEQSDIVLKCRTIAEVEAIREMVRQSPVLLLHAPPTMAERSRYVSPGGVRRATASRRTVSPITFVTIAGCVDVDRPADPNAVAVSEGIVA